MFEKYMLKMFNKRAGSDESRPDEILSHLDIRSGESITDVGSGGGYFTYRFAEEGRTNLLDKSVDLVFSRNAFHHIKNPVRYFRKLKKALRPEGRVAIIANKKEKGLMSRLGHSSSKEEIVQSLEKAGYRLERSFDFLDQQWFLVFSVDN